MRIWNFGVSILFLALACSLWWLGDWTVSAEHDRMLFQEVQQLTLYILAVWFASLSLTCLLWRKRHIDAWLDNTPTADLPLNGEVTKPGKVYDRLFD